MMIITPLFREAMKRIAQPGATIIDIGGGLRVSKEKGNRYDPAQEWLLPILAKTDYKILDPVDTYNPDIIGDIHALPFADNSIDSIVCLSVLEHIEDPMLACREMYRVLKPQGALFLYVPFLFYYHAEKGYYKDYWRFTEDSLHLLLKNYSSLEVEPTRGAIETWLNLLPMGGSAPIRQSARLLDTVFHKKHSRQTAGYHALAIK